MRQLRRSKRLKGIAIVGLIFALVSCQSSQQEAEKPPGGWSSKMQEFSAILAELMPLVVNRKKFNDPANEARIERDVKRLATLSHDVSGPGMQKMMKSMDQDPAISYIAKSFKMEMQHALGGLQRGRRGYARNVLRHVSGYCVQCHTRGQFGPEFTLWKDKSSLKSLDKLDQAEIYSAVRRYDSALTLYEDVVKDVNWAKTKSLGWERAVREALNISVRVKKDPKRGLAIVDSVLNTPRVALFLKNDAQEWRKSLLSWKGERGKKVSDPFKEARQLIRKAENSQQFLADQSSLILYLRASSMLHDALRQEVKPYERAQIFSLLGKSYDAVGSRGAWSLSDLYYQACIRQKPHSRLAMGCYSRYEANKYFGYSGSAGVSIPGSVVSHLRELRALASPEMKEH